MIEYEKQTDIVQLKREFSSASIWFSRHAWLVGSIVTSITVYSLLLYIVTMNLPISIFSPYLVIALPQLFIMMLLFALLLGGIFCFPVVAAFTNFNKPGKSPIDDIKINNFSENLSFYKYFTLIPIGIQCILICASLEFALNGQKSLWIPTLALIFGIFFHALSVVALCRKKNVGLPSLDFCIIFIFSSIIQIFDISLFFLVAERLFRPYTSWLHETLFYSVFLFFVVYFFAVFFQLLILRIAQLNRRTSPAMNLVAGFKATALAFFVLLIFPYSSIALMSEAIKVTSMGGVSCVYMTLRNTSGVSNDILNNKGDRKTKGLRLVILIGATYYVRRHNKKENTTFFVLKDNIQSISKCNADRKRND